jgi:hypothetical protein
MAFSSEQTHGRRRPGALAHRLVQCCAFTPPSPKPPPETSVHGAALDGGPATCRGILRVASQRRGNPARWVSGRERLRRGLVHLVAQEPRPGKLATQLPQ